MAGLRGNLLDGGEEAVKVDGLGQVFGEARFLALADVLVHAEAAEGDGAGGAMLADAADQIQPGAVGEAEIADDQVELLVLAEVEGLLDAGGDVDAVAGALEQAGHEAGGVIVVFDQEDAQIHAWSRGGLG